MTGIKKFCDFLAFFALFWLGVFIFRKFMPYNPTGIESKIEKLKHFFSKDNYTDYRPYLWLIGLLVLSLAAGRLFARFPAITLAMSALPFIQALSMYLDNKLYEWTAIYLTLCFMPVIGAAADAIYLDRNDGKRRLFHAANVAGLMAVPYCAYVYMRYEKLYGVLVSEVEKTNLFDRFLAKNYSNINPKHIIITAAFFAAAVLISYIWRDLYYLDVLVSFAPLVYFVRPCLPTGSFYIPLSYLQ